MIGRLEGCSFAHRSHNSSQSLLQHHHFRYQFVRCRSVPSLSAFWYSESNEAWPILLAPHSRVREIWLERLDRS
jgi:hypothetical protein